jgi:hypothetical protein
MTHYQHKNRVWASLRATCWSCFAPSLASRLGHTATIRRMELIVTILCAGFIGFAAAVQI